MATDRLHVYPANDLVEHDTETDDCVCGPEFAFLEGGLRITHHSLDGREEREEMRNADCSMVNAVAGLLELGLTQKEIAEAFARTGPDGEDPLDVALEILKRRTS